MASLTLTTEPDGALRLPPEILAELGIGASAEVQIDIDVEGGNLHFEPEDDPWLRDPEYRARIQKGLDDIAAGRVRRMSEEDFRRLAPVADD